jgi:possible murein hydrolase regulator lrgA
MCNKLLPLPVPAGVYGLIFMLIFLMQGIIPLDAVEQVGNFMLETMSIMFLPAAVGIMTVTKLLMPVLVPYLVIIVLSTIIVMAVTGLVSQRILKVTETREDKIKEMRSMESALEKKEKIQEEIREIQLEDLKHGLKGLEED